MYTRTQFQLVAKRAVLSAMWLGVALFYAWGCTIPAAASQVDGLQTPQSFLADPSGEFYFISNINGEADAKDNNGFITRLDKDGKITERDDVERTERHGDRRPSSLRRRRRYATRV